MDKAIEIIQFKKSPKQSTASVTEEKSRADYFFVKTNRKMVKVNYDEILFVESYGEYVKIYTTDDIILALQRTSFMEEVLPSDDFIRIHRSHIININRIKEIDGNTVLIDQHRLTVSKRMKEQFILMIGRKGVI